MTRDVVEMWTVYDHPKDFPHGYVARLWLIDDGTYGPTAEVIASDSLTVIRTVLAGKGLQPLDRRPDDDPVIMETWL